jgi:FHS family L-fucose permease-like MFS transporter
VRPLLSTIYFIYFFCGVTQCFEGVFLPEFKEYFHLNYQQQMYTMLAKNAPFILAGGIGYLIRFLGYKNCMTAATMLFSGGTLLLVPGLRSGRYAEVLLGFFLIGLGFNFEIVAGNPMLSALGPSRSASSRLNLGNALGAVAQIIAPATVSAIIPVTVITVDAKLPYMERLFIALGVVLAFVSAVTFLARDVNISSTFRNPAVPRGAAWSHKRVRLGFTAIFLILGVEAGLFAFYRNFLEDPAIAGLSAHQSQLLFTVFFAVFALGRLVASWVQTRILPSTHLILSLAGAFVCLAVAIFAKGLVAVGAITCIGFFASVLFPTLYSLSIENMGELTGQASGLLTMGFLGCAVIPVLQGKLADSVGLAHSYSLSLVAYLCAMFCAVKMCPHTIRHRDTG